MKASTRRVLSLSHRLGQLLFLDHDRLAAVGLETLAWSSRSTGSPVSASTNTRRTRWPVLRLTMWKATRSEVEAAAQGDRADELPDLEMAFPDRA